MRCRVLTGSLLAAVLLAGCSAGADDDALSSARERQPTGGEVLKSAVASLREAGSGEYLVRTSDGNLANYSIDGSYDLEAGESTLEMRDSYVESGSDEMVYQHFERVVTADRVAVRSGSYVVGVAHESDEGWEDVTGVPEWDTSSARGPEPVRLLEDLEIVPSQADEVVDGGRLRATAAASLVIDLVYPTSRAESDVDSWRGGDPEVEVELVVIDGVVKSAQIDLADVAHTVGDDRLEEMGGGDWLAYNLRLMEAITVRFTGLGETVVPMPQDLGA